WPHLGSPDRFLRSAARVAMEHQDVKSWQEKALTEPNPQARITALLALTRVSAPCPDHHKSPTPPDAALRDAIQNSLLELPFSKLATEERLELLRVFHVLYHRFGKPSVPSTEAVQKQLLPFLPSGQKFVDTELLQLLVFLQTAEAAERGMKLLTKATTQEEQIDHARTLRMLKTGWTPTLREQYFRWIAMADNYKGGASFGGFIAKIKTDAIATLTDSEKTAMKLILETKLPDVPNAPARKFVQVWKTADLTSELDTALAGGRNFEAGKRLFAETKCAACHRYAETGGISGPDLTQVAGRFAPRDLLESIIDPSKEVSDQYQATEIETDDGRKIVGRIVNLNNDSLSISTNMLDPNNQTGVNRGSIVSMKPSKVSMMPSGLIDVLSKDEIYDLLAYTLSRGDAKNKMFTPKK
ncbi:MAG: c-type cytochrome, partial [Gemmataceae bacterium]